MHTAKKVFIALPVYGAAHTGFIQSLLRVIAQPPCEIHLGIHQGDSLVSRARNALAADFLASDCTHLLFIDSDLVFSGDHIKRLLDHDADVVGGMYPKKQEGPLQWVLNTLPEGRAGTPLPAGEADGSGVPSLPKNNGLQEVRYIGTGFMMIKRRVFDFMINGRLAPEYKTDQAPRRIEHDFFSVGVYNYPDGSARYLSEDWFFCQRWLDAGGQVFADTRVILKHIGQAVYPLKTQEPEIIHPIQERSAEHRSAAA